MGASHPVLRLRSRGAENHLHDECDRGPERKAGRLQKLLAESGLA
jgi:hypothetical protein